MLSPLLAVLLLSLSLLVLMHSYRQRERVGVVFWAFLLLALASLLWTRALWLAPVAWLFMAVALGSLSWRTLTASLLGLLLPAWAGLPWLLYHDRLTAWMTEGLQQLLPSVWFTVEEPYLRPTMLLWLCCALWAAVCLQRYYRGKSNVRLRIVLLYRVFALLPWLLLGWALLLPADVWVVAPLSAVCSFLLSRLWMPSLHS